MSKENHPAYLAMLKREAAKETTMNKFETVVQEYYDIAAQILLSKHRDYGPKNISQAPGGAINGLRVRMHDKLARINNLYDADVDPENESLRDSFLDMMNYAAIGLMVLDGEWPNE